MPSGCYVDNAMNRRLGRVGMPYGSAVHSASSVSSYSSGRSGCYVDNAMNRRLGRVGMAYGTAVHSTSSVSSYSSGRSGCYVDNAMNRRLGRVGMPYGTAVHSKYGSYSSSSQVYNIIYVDNRSFEGARPQVPAIHSSNNPGPYCLPSTYDDYELNDGLRNLGLRGANDCGDRYDWKVTSREAPSAVNTKKPTITELKGTGHDASPATGTKKPVNIESKNTGSEAPPAVNTKKPTITEPKNTGHDASPARKPKKPINVDLKSEQIIQFSDLVLKDKIGGGGFGDVHKASWKDQDVAVKKLRVQRVSKTKLKQFEDEVRSIAALDHPSIVEFYGACIVTPNLALIMEFLPGGSLYDNLHCLKVQFEDETKDQFVRDYFSALVYIHSKNMVHRDLKSKNIMLSDDKSRCKLADFGLALKDHIETNSTTRHGDFAGTEKYCPKEVLDGKRLTMAEYKSADVYSLALTTFELIIEEEPFDECRNIHEIRRAIMNGDILEILENNDSGISAAKKNLLRSALSDNRPTAIEFLTRFNSIVAAKN